MTLYIVDDDDVAPRMNDVTVEFLKIHKEQAYLWASL